MMEMGLWRVVMKKIVDWINSHKITTVCIALLLLVVQPFFVHLFLKIPAPSPFFVREWGAGDLITYIAGFEAFVGTVFLGTVAIYQNKKSQELSNRLLSIEEKNSTLTRCPNLDIDCSNISVMCLGDIFKLNSSILCTQEIYDIVTIDPVECSDSCLLLTLSLNNLSSSNLIVQLISLEVTPVDMDTDIKISNFTLLPYRANSLHISPSKEKSLGVVLDYKKYQNCAHFDSKMELLVTNNISDEFLYTLNFTAYTLKNGKHLFFYLSDINHKRKLN